MGDELQTIAMATTGTKRSKRSYSDDESECNHQSNKSGSETETFTETYLVIEPSEQNKTFNTTSPFLIEKSLSAIIGTVKNVKKLKDGKLLVEIFREKQSQNLQKLDTFCDIKVKVYPHKTLNSSKGIIRDRRLYNCSEEEIKENLANQGVTHVRRIQIRKENDTIKTNTLILTFNNPKLPKNLKIFFQLISVTPYIPNPLRCFQCQKFGHHENNCKNSPVCGICAGVGNHHEASCQNPVKCANCGEPHPSKSNQCPIWKKEKEITRVKFTNNISYPEARKLVENIPTITYSSIVKSSTLKSAEMKDAQTQTVDASTQTPTLETYNTNNSIQQKTDKKHSTVATNSSTQEVEELKQSGTPMPKDGKNKTKTSSRQEEKPVTNTGKTPARKKNGSNKDPRNKNKFEALADGVQDQMDCQDLSDNESRQRSRSPVLPPKR